MVEIKADLDCPCGYKFSIIWDNHADVIREIECPKCGTELRCEYYDIKE